MKLKLTYIALLLFTVSFAQVNKISHVKTHPTSFAIVIDKETFELTKDAVYAYRDAIEQDGLSAYIIVNNWKNPEEIKAELLKLYGSKPKLEGAVFIGNIPIPMLRNGQHMASAFKLDEERYNWQRSSVPSDRFYEDFDLKFNFLKQDSAKKDYFYYSIAPESPQRIEKEIYSARIKPSGDNKVDKIKKYLFRVAKQKLQQNKIDKSLVFTGHGYLSESLAAWSDEKISLMEQFPQLFAPGGRVKVLFHSMDREMKEILLTELQDKNLDIAIFHAHGDDDLQLISEFPTPRNAQENLESAKQFFRSKITGVRDRKGNVEEAIKYYKTNYDVPDSWFENIFSDSVVKADSLLAYSLDIHMADVRAISTQAKFMMFDECFNGSFHLDEYIAGEHVFGSGNVIVGEANSVNVLQDKWADEYLGLLNNGVRVGNWHRLRNHIESALIGDPTFRFTSDNKDDLNKLLVLENDNAAVWKKLLSSKDADIKSLAIRKLFRINGSKMDQDLVKMYGTDLSVNVRMHALKSLAELNNNSFRNIVKTSINDPYEFIRRKSADWMGEIGDTAYLPLLAETIITDESERVSYNARSSSDFLGAEPSYLSLMKYLNEMPQIVSKDKWQKSFRLSADNNTRWLYKELIPNIFSDTLKLKSRLNEIRTFRNYRFINGIPELIKLALTKNVDKSVRTHTVEALGWYTFSLQKDNILFACDKIISDTENPQEVIQEAIRTKNRLLTGNNDVLIP